MMMEQDRYGIATKTDLLIASECDAHSFEPLASRRSLCAGCQKVLPERFDLRSRRRLAVHVTQWDHLSNGSDELPFALRPTSMVTSTEFGFQPWIGCARLSMQFSCSRPDRVSLMRTSGYVLA
jgi:hypothetical protein